MTISRVQGNARGTTTGSSITVTMTSTPTNGNILVAVIDSSVVSDSGYVTVSGISQTGVNWSQSKQVGEQYNDGVWDALNVEIWAGVVGSGASSTLTVTLSGSATEGAACDVCEYSGVATSSFLDRKAVSSGKSSTPNTGETNTTTTADELWIGGIVSYETKQTSATHSFTLLDGVVISGPTYPTGLSYLEYIASATGQAYTSVNNSVGNGWVGCIATFKAATSSGGPANQSSCLRFRKGTDTYAVCVVPDGSGQSGMGGIPKIRKGGVTYDIYLVDTTDSFASPIRIQTTTGTKALRYYTTYSDTAHSDTAYADAHSDIPFADTAHSDFSNAIHTNYTDYNGIYGYSGYGTGFINYTDASQSSHLDASEVSISQYQDFTNVNDSYWHADFSDASGATSLQYGDSILPHCDQSTFPISYQDHSDSSVHSDTAFSDTAHSDSHTNVAYSDVAHADGETAPTF